MYGDTVNTSYGSVAKFYYFTLEFLHDISTYLFHIFLTLYSHVPSLFSALNQFFPIKAFWIFSLRGGGDYPKILPPCIKRE
jgi:hypothetical protein